MPQEFEAEPLTLARTLDQAGHVGDGVPRLARLHDTEVWMQRGERIVRYLRLRRRDRSDKAGLASRGVAHQRNIRHDFEFEEDIALPTGNAEKRKPRSFSLGGRERRIAESALAAGSHDVAHARLGEVDQFVALGVFDNGAERNSELDLRAVGAAAVVTHALAALFGLAMGRAMEAK